MCNGYWHNELFCQGVLNKFNISVNYSDLTLTELPVLNLGCVMYTHPRHYTPKSVMCITHPRLNTPMCACVYCALHNP